jgi:hypothetical protein
VHILISVIFFDACTSKERKGLVRMNEERKGRLVLFPSMIVGDLGEFLFCFPRIFGYLVNS